MTLSNIYDAPNAKQTPSFSANTCQISRLRQLQRMVAISDSQPDPSAGRPTNRKHRAWAQAVAAGMTQVEAYQRYISRKCTRESARQQACGFFRRFHGYIHDLRTKITDKAESAWIVGKVEMMHYLSRAVRTPIAEIDEHSDLASELKIQTSPDGSETRTIKMVNKLDAASQLVKIAGYEAAQQVNHSHLISISPAMVMLERRPAQILNSGSQSQPRLTEGSIIDLPNDQLSNSIVDRQADELMTCNPSTPAEDCEISQAIWQQASTPDDGQDA